MSHATGAVRFVDGEVLFFEYNGTSDIACSSLKRTIEEVNRDWRSSANHADCTCGGVSEDVELMSFYGDGMVWDGKACRKCMALTGDRTPDDGFVSDTPQWARDAVRADKDATDTVY